MLLSFLNHWLQNTRSCRKKKNSFKRTPFFFLYFQTATCYNSSLVFSRLGSPLVKAAYNIACPPLNGDSLISLYAELLMLERVWILLPQFWADTKVTHVQDNSYVIATNKLKNKVLKNKTMNGKRLRIIWWMVKEGQKGDSTYHAQRKAFPLIKKECRKLVFHGLA